MGLITLQLQRCHWRNLWLSQKRKENGQKHQFNYWLLEGHWIWTFTTQKHWNLHFKIKWWKLRIIRRTLITNQQHAFIKIHWFLWIHCWKMEVKFRFHLWCDLLIERSVKQMVFLGKSLHLIWRSEKGIAQRK